MFPEPSTLGHAIPAGQPRQTPLPVGAYEPGSQGVVTSLYVLAQLLPAGQAVQKVEFSNEYVPEGNREN